VVVLTGGVSKVRHFAKPLSVTNNPKKTTQRTIYYIKIEKEKKDKMNNQHTKQHISTPLKPMHHRSLQKCCTELVELSCFLADAPKEIDKIELE
jgi:hypothetical protein